mgnify:CR=1 FL=1|tara:strand:+ start:28 stop:210 length:183 start_codon:yes stop_codon:yes gene_type:complete
MKEFVDGVIGKLVSRKLLAWGTATFLAMQGALHSEDWVAVTVIYIGSQAAVDLAKAWKSS